MAQARPIFQPFAPNHLHVRELNSLLAEPWLDEVILSSAFANDAGIAVVAGAIAPIARRCRVFLGVRNGSTTAQALVALLRLGVSLYAVDTATRMRIFHPKLYLARGAVRARSILGSANLTHAGLHNNIEASVDLDLDLNDPGDRAFVNVFMNGFNNLLINYSQHCFPVTSIRQVLTMMRQGLLEDERNPKTVTALGVGHQGGQTSKSPIALPFITTRTRSSRARYATSAPHASRLSASPTLGPLAWIKPSLPSSDLQLNTGSNVPGVLRLTQAGYRVAGKTIDQTRYFRHHVFAGLNWTYDPVRQKEVAAVGVSLIVAGVYVGNFDLSLSHKLAWAAGQGNYTTGLHWAGAVAHIRHPGLIGRSLKLYQPGTATGRFVIDID